MLSIRDSCRILFHIPATPFSVRWFSSLSCDELFNSCLVTSLTTQTSGHQQPCFSTCTIPPTSSYVVAVVDTSLSAQLLTHNISAVIFIFSGHSVSSSSSSSLSQTPGPCFIHTVISFDAKATQLYQGSIVGIQHAFLFWRDPQCLTCLGSGRTALSPTVSCNRCRITSQILCLWL